MHFLLKQKAKINCFEVYFLKDVFRLSNNTVSAPEEKMVMVKLDSLVGR